MGGVAEWDPAALHVSPGSTFWCVKVVCKLGIMNLEGSEMGPGRPNGTRLSQEKYYIFITKYYILLLGHVLGRESGRERRKT